MGENLMTTVPQWVVVVCFSCIVFLSVLSNVPVLVAFVTHRTMKTVTNVFIVCLAVSDLLIGVVVTSLSMLQTTSPGITTGLACKLPPYIELSCLTASIYSLLFVSLDRYLAVVHPVIKLNLKKAVFIVAGIWIWAWLYGARLFIQQKIGEPENDGPQQEFSTVDPGLARIFHSFPEILARFNGTEEGVGASNQTSDECAGGTENCTVEDMSTVNLTDDRLQLLESLSNHLNISNNNDDTLVDNDHDNDDRFCNLLVEEDADDLKFRIIDLVILFFVPLGIMSFLYVRVGQRLWSNKVAVTNLVRQKRKIVKFLIANVLVFVISWIPFYLTDIVHDTLEVVQGDEAGEAMEEDLRYVIIRFIVTLLALSNSFVNPVLYAFFNENFKYVLKDFARRTPVFFGIRGPRVEPRPSLISGDFEGGPPLEPRRPVAGRTTSTAIKESGLETPARVENESSVGGAAWEVHPFIPKASSTHMSGGNIGDKRGKGRYRGEKTGDVYCVENEAKRREGTQKGVSHGTSCPYTIGEPQTTIKIGNASPATKTGKSSKRLNSLQVKKLEPRPCPSVFKLRDAVLNLPSNGAGNENKTGAGKEGQGNGAEKWNVEADSLRARHGIEVQNVAETGNGAGPEEEHATKAEDTEAVGKHHREFDGTTKEMPQHVVRASEKAEEEEEARIMKVIAPWTDLENGPGPAQ